MDATDVLPIEIWMKIFTELDFESKLSMISACNYFRISLWITDLYNIPEKYIKKLTDKVLSYNIFKNINLLRACHLTKITQNGIIGQDLIELNAEGNPLITSVVHMKRLRRLNASGTCGIGEAGLHKSSTFASASIDDPNGSFSGGITGLNLTELDARRNSKIKSVIGIKSILKPPVIAGRWKYSGVKFIQENAEFFVSNLKVQNDKIINIEQNGLFVLIKEFNADSNKIGVFRPIYDCGKITDWNLHLSDYSDSCIENVTVSEFDSCGNPIKLLGCFFESGFTIDNQEATAGYYYLTKLV